MLKPKLEFKFSRFGIFVYFSIIIGKMLVFYRNYFFPVWASFMLTWEMMVLSALSTYCLRPSKTILFDKYPIIDSTSCCINESQGPCPIQLPVSGNVGSTETIESRVKEDLKLNNDQIIQRFDSI